MPGQAAVDAAPRALAGMDEGLGQDALQAPFRDAERWGASDLTRIPLDAGLRNFCAQAIVDQEIEYTIVGGRFSPTTSIDLTSQDVILSVTGVDSFRLSVSAGSFRETGLGGYVASVKRSLSKTDILLQPFRCGDWAYSAGIEGFVPGSKPVTVSLTIGSQAGTATVKGYAF